MDVIKSVQNQNGHASNNVGKKNESLNAVKRSINVEASGEFVIVPDQCHLLITVSSHKGSVSQAKDSVDRRVLYIKQAIQNAQIQDSEVRTFNSVQHGYSHTTEMFLTCSDVKKLCNLSEVLTQKLDESVSLSSISFSVSPSAMSHARAQSASNAVVNARKKAVEMARLVEGSLGSPIAIEQLACEESSTQPLFSELHSTTQSQFSSWQQSCKAIKSAVRIMFDLKPRKN